MQNNRQNTRSNNVRTSTRWLGFCLLLLQTLLGTSSHAQIAAWDFTGTSTPATWAAALYNTNLDTSSGRRNVTRGSAASASAGSNSFRTTGFQNNGIATSNTDYFQTTLKAATGYTISLSSIDAAFNGTASFCVSPGVASQFAYSLDGSTFTLIGSSFNLVGQPVSMSRLDLSGITALQNVSATTTIYLRYYASGQTTSGGWGYYSSGSGVYGLAIGGTLNTAGSSCTGTPAAGTATGTTTICSGSSTVLHLNGSSRSPGIAWQWQSSATGATGTFSNISGATDTNYTTAALTANTWYRAITTCTTSSLTATSNTDTVTVTASVTPTISISASPSATVCAGTAVTFTSSNTNGGATPAWQWKNRGSNITGATAATYSYTPTNADTISCSMTSTATCASPAGVTSSGIPMRVYALPNPTISGTATISSGGSTNIVFSGTTGDSVYYWNGSTTNRATIVAGGSTTVTVSPTITTTYSVTTATNANGCTNTITGQFAIITVSTGSPSDTIPSQDSNMVMGNPSNATTASSDSNNYLMIKPQYALSYNNSKGMANWLSWHLSSAWKGSVTRCDCFSQDAALPSGYFRAATSNYTGTGFDRGHLCPSDDRDSTAPDNSATFLMTNISPQAPNLNQQTWNDLEGYCRDLIYRGNELYIIAGGYGNGGSGSSGGTTTSFASGNIKVPSHFWKIIVVLPVNINDLSRVSTATRVISVIMPNNQTVNTNSWDYYTTTVDSIESLTGYNFLSNVPVAIQNVIEAKKDSRLAAWDFTGAGAYTSSPATILNAHLDTATGYNTLTRGGSAAASTGASSFRTTGFQNNGISTSNTDYFQVKLRAASGYSLSLSSIDATMIGTAAFYAAPGVTYQYAYSLNGTTFTLIGSPVTSSSLTPPTVYLNSISALQNVPSTTTVYLRYYASGQTTTGGWGYDSPYSGTYGLDIGGSVTIPGCTGTPASGTTSAASDTVCAGSAASVTLSTTATGSAFSYQWQSSATGGAGTYSNISGATNITYAPASLSADTYFRCNTTCLTSVLTATSTATPVRTRATVTPSVTVATTPSAAVCAGTTTTFTATPVNGGLTPAYQWKKGGTNIGGATNATYSYTPTHGDVITCQLTSNATCPSTPTALSAATTLTVTATVTPSVTVAASPGGMVCAGTTVSYSATPANGGATPAYQWRKGATAITGATAASYSYTPANNDTITCLLTTSATCPSTATALSAATINTVSPVPPPAGAITGTTTVFTGGTTTLTNPTAGSGTLTWASSAPAVASVSSAGLVTGISAGNAIITCTVTNSCGTNSDTAIVTVTAAPATIAGWDFTGASSVATWAASLYHNNLDTASARKNVIRGAGAGASTGSNSFRTIGFQNDGIAVANTDYFQVAIKPRAGYSLSLSSVSAVCNGTASYCASPGVSQQFAYSLDGTTFTLVGSPIVTIGAPATVGPVALSSISPLQNVTSTSTIYLRFYATGQTATGGWGFYSSASGVYGLSLGGTLNLTPCSGTPAHATISGGSTICSGSTANLVLGGFSRAGSIGYQWQSSTGSGFSNIAGATDTVYSSTALSATTIYRCITLCTASGNSDTSATATVTVTPTPIAGTITGNTLLCLNMPETLTTTGTTGGTWSSSNTTIATVTAGSATGLSAGTATITYRVTNSCGSDTAVHNVTAVAMQWLGGTPGHETDWHTAANWSCGTVPDSTYDVQISSTTNLPAFSGTVNVRNLVLNSGTTLAIAGGATLGIYGHFSNNGIVAGTGTVLLKGNSPQLITGMGKTTQLAINNAAGVTIATGSRITVTGKLALQAGYLSTSDSLVLQSDSAGTAYIAALPAATGISGNVRVQQYIQGGLRRFRFLSHPFNSYTGLNQLTDDINITGSGGSSNGFTSTSSNAPSAFRYDPLSGNSAMGYDPGWKPFTHTGTAADSNRFQQYQGIRLFMRGSYGEGLGYTSYTPSPVTLTMNGNINQGDQHIILKKGSSANQDYNMTGNPYPSPVDIGTVLYHAWHRGAITGGAFYVWNPSAGAAGQYVAVPINTTTPTAWYLPAYSAFQVRAAHNGDTLHFSENDKGAAAAGYLFRQQSTGITLTVSDTSGKVWNRLTIHFDSGATAAEDRSDAALLQSPGFSWYSLSTDDKKLVIDHRPFTPTVALGIKSDQAGQFVIAANLADIPEDLWLRDKYLHTSVRLTSGLQYTFSITSNPASQGDARFELATAGNHDIDAEIISITPNPADNLLTVHFPASENQAVIDITDGSGKIVYHGTISANTALPVASLATGVYVVRLRFSNSSWTGKLLKR